MRFATPVGAYEIDSVPSQPQVAHCHAFFVPNDLRGRGLAHILKESTRRQRLRPSGTTMQPARSAAATRRNIAY
jgi:predicted GNAT family acetyltransferase